MEAEKWKYAERIWLWVKNVYVRDYCSYSKRVGWVHKMHNLEKQVSKLGKYDAS